MSLVKLLEKISPVEEIDLLEDKINSFSINAILSEPPSFEESAFHSLLKGISASDRFVLSITVENNTPVTLTKREDLSAFLKHLQESFELYEEHEKIILRLEIVKGLVKNIYAFDKFQEFWAESNTINILSVLGSILERTGVLSFPFVESKQEPFYSGFIVFGLKTTAPKENSQIRLQDNCHFGNAEFSSLSPYHFFLLNRPTNENYITRKMDVLSTLFSIIYIFDITSIQDGKLHYKLNGYKSHEGSLTIDESFVKSTKIYFEVFDWIYSSNSNVSEKLGIARNILSIYLKEDIRDLDENILPSIKSAFKTYLKENVDRYIEIRSSILHELEWVSQKAGDIVEKHLVNYKRSIFSFISFFASVFILQVLRSESLINIFSKEATILSLAFLVISLLYLGFSLWTVSTERKRLRRKYGNIKSRYKDLLIQEDIDKILNKDAEFNYEMSYVDRQTLSYTILWILTIIVLIIAVFMVSNYISVEALWGKIQNLKVFVD